MIYIRLKYTLNELQLHSTYIESPLSRQAEGTNDTSCVTYAKLRSRTIPGSGG